MKKILLLALCCLALSGCGEKTIVCVSDYSYDGTVKKMTDTFKYKKNLVISQKHSSVLETDDIKRIEDDYDYSNRFCEYNKDFKCSTTRNNNRVEFNWFAKCNKETDNHNCDLEETLKFYKEDPNTKCTEED